MESMKFADNVWHRVVQIIQEAMLTGVDCADLLRQVRVVSSESDVLTLELSPEYETQVRDMHTKMLDQARDLQSAQAGNKFIIQGGSGDGN